MAWGAAVAIAVAACATDIRRRRIPNILTFGGAAAGLVCHRWNHGFSGLPVGIGGWIAGVAVFLPLFLLRGLGAGDLKLLGALGTWVGARDVLWVALYTTISGGILALLVAARHRRLRESVRNMGFLLWYWRNVGVKPVPDLTLEQSKGPRLPYAVPILAGALVRVWLSAQ